MDSSKSTDLDPTGDSENENFVVIDVSDEEFNSAIDNSCEDIIDDIVINKINLNIGTRKEENSSDEEEDDDDESSEESGAHLEGKNLVVKEEPIIFTREDAENDNVETEIVLNTELISVENGNKLGKDEDSNSDSSEGSENLSEPEEKAEGDSDSNDDSDLYDTTSSDDDSDDVTSDSNTDDSDDVSSDSDGSENEGENLSDDSEEAVVSDSDNSDDSSEFSGGEGEGEVESDDGSPKNMEEDQDSNNSSPEMDQEEDGENKENLSEENNSSDDGKSSSSSPEEAVDSPGNSDSGESSHSEGEKNRMSENAEENFDDAMNVSESEENIFLSPNSEGGESFPNSPRSEDEKSNSPGSPNSEKSYQSVLSDEAGSPNSNRSSDNSGSDSPRSVQSEGSPKSGSSSGSGSPSPDSPDSQNGQNVQESLSLPNSPRSGSSSGSSSNSGSPNSCDPGSPSPPQSPNSPRTPPTPGSDEVHSPNLSDEANNADSRSNSDEEETLKEIDGDSSSPGNSPESNDPTSPQSQSSSSGSKSPSEGSGSPRSINSAGSPLSDESSSSENFGSPEEYPLSPVSPDSNFEDEVLSPQSPSSPLDNSPQDFNEENDADSENGNKSDDENEGGPDQIEMDFENVDSNIIMCEENEDLVDADDEDSQESDGSASEEQWIDVESEEDENNGSDNEVVAVDSDSESEGSDSDDQEDSEGEGSSDSWDSYDSDDDSSDSEDYEVALNEIEDKNKLTDIKTTTTTEECMTGSLNVGNFEEEGKILLVDDDSDNWEDVNSSSEEDEDDSSEKESESDSGEDIEDEKPILNLETSTVLSAEDEVEDDLENDDDEEEDDWEIIDDNNNITEDENNLSDSDSSSSSKSSSNSSSSSDDAVEIDSDPEKVETVGNDDNYNIFEGEDEIMQTDSIENFVEDDTSIENGINTEQLLELIDTVKQDNYSVANFSKMNLKEYLKTTGFIDENLNEKNEKTMEPKDLAQLISQQDNNLNSVSLGPDYEPEEIKNEISRFWGFYHSMKKSDSQLGEELTAFLVPMLIYFYAELITSALPSLAIELFTIFGDKFIKEGGDTTFIKELMILSEIKDKAEFEKNEHLESFQDRKYSFSLSVAAFEKLSKFLAKSRTPVLISLFSDRFVTKLKFPDVQEVKVEEFENGIENDCDENEEENSDSEDLSFEDLVDEDINKVSRAKEVIRKLRSNPLIAMPSVTVYTSNGRPVCGAMSAQGTMVAYGMDPAGIRLCKTAKAQYFSDEDKENQNENQPGVLNLNAHEGTVYDVAFHPKTKLLYSVGYDGFMRAWDLHKDKPSNRCVYSGHLGAIWTMDIAPSGRMIATGGMDTTARLWLPERNDYVRLFVGHYFDVDCVKFHPNESYLATGSIDKSVRLWSINDGNMVRILTGCPGRVNALAFHESGKYIAGGGEDDIIRIWDIAEGDLLYELPSEMCCKDLSFYGNKLAGCFDKSIVQIWDLKILLGGDDEISADVKKEENDTEKFYNIFGDGKSSSDEENERNEEITIPAPYSIECNTEFLFKVNFKDAANVFCLGAEKKLVFDDEPRERKSSVEDNSCEERVVSPEVEESLPLPPLTLHDYPFLDSEHRATIACLEEGPVDSFDYSGGCSTEAPNAMSVDEIDTSEQDKVRAEVETYDKLVKSTQQDDDTWLTDL